MNGADESRVLCAEDILVKLQPHASEAIHRLRVLEETDSTNARLLAEAPRSGFDVLFAETQTAGRGRRGRSWHSPKGAHLYMSLGYVYAGNLSQLPPLALAVGLACAQAVTELTALPVRLKWPNDLYLDGRKLGGILIETQPLGNGQVHVVVGIGLNVRMPAEAAAMIDQPWSDLQSAATIVDRNRLAAQILDSLVTTLYKFASDGFAAFRADFERHDLLLNREVDIHDASGVQRARARGVDANGALLVEMAGDGVLRPLHAGEVSIRL